MIKYIIFSFIKVFPPEVSHSIVLKLLKFNPFPKSKIKKEKVLQTNLLGYKLSNPLGLAAGFDKSGDAIKGLLKLHFSFIEIGTITPNAQSGNNKPRVFRLRTEKAIINKLGFPNKGINKLVKELSKLRRIHPLGSEPIIGVNIGCNKSSKKPRDDYITCLRKVYCLADYITINVSSPNTPGLRNLQKKEKLTLLLKEINNERIFLKNKFNRSLPIVIKVSPNLSNKKLQQLINISIKYKLDGVIATNTTTDQNVIKRKANLLNGGISGKPLLESSNKVLEKIKYYGKNKLQIIGLGGVDDASSAYEKMRLGATAIQMYTGLVYKGPNLIEKILNDLAIMLNKKK